MFLLQDIRSRWALWAVAASTAKEAIQILPVIWQEPSLNLLLDLMYVTTGFLALMPRIRAETLEEFTCGPSMALFCCLSWLRLLFALRGERWLGPRFLPIMFALRDTFAFSLVAILCLTASAHAYYVLNARGEDPFPVYSSVMQTLRLGMFGDFDMFEFQGQDTTFHRQNATVWEPVDPVPSELGLEQYVAIQVVFYLTGIGITILLMNLLIGVLGQNYELYEDQAPQLFTRARARILLQHQDRPWFLLASWLQPWQTQLDERPSCWIMLLVGPLHLALGECGKTLVAQNFTRFWEGSFFTLPIWFIFLPFWLLFCLCLWVFIFISALFFRLEGLQYLCRVALLGCFGTDAPALLAPAPNSGRLRARFLWRVQAVWRSMRGAFQQKVGRRVGETSLASGV